MSVIPKSGLGLTLLTLAFGVLAPVVGQQRGFQPEDYYDIVEVSDVAVSPAGEFGRLHGDTRSGGGEQAPAGSLDAGSRERASGR